jgi:hypothetical protein
MRARKVMKDYVHLLAIGVWGLLLTGQAWAQATTNGTISTTTRDRIGTVVVPEKTPTADAAANTAVRPVRPERNTLPPAVIDRVARFKREARLYLERQEVLEKQMRGATEAERAKIRAQLSDLLEQRRAQAIQLREEFKDRLPELREKLSSHREMLEKVREDARESVAGGTPTTSPRPRPRDER